MIACDDGEKEVMIAREDGGKEVMIACDDDDGSDDCM